MHMQNFCVKSLFLYNLKNNKNVFHLKCYITVVLMRIKLSNRKGLYEDIKRSLRKIAVGIMEESVR